MPCLVSDFFIPTHWPLLSSIHHILRFYIKPTLTVFDPLSSMDKNSSHPKQKTICERLQMAIGNRSPFRMTHFNTSHEHHKGAAIARTAPSANVCLKPDRCARVSEQPVSPVIFNAKAQKIDPQGNEANQAKPKASDDHKAQEKATLLPILGNENRVPSLGESGHVKSAATESINRMFSEYIHRTKYKFQDAPSIVETASFN